MMSSDEAPHLRQLFIDLRDQEFSDRQLGWLIQFTDTFDASSLEEFWFNVSVPMENDYVDVERIGDPIVIAIVDRLRQCERLQSLHLTLDGSYVGAEGIHAIVDWVRQRKIPIDLHLGLRHVHLDDDDARALGQLVACLDTHPLSTLSLDLYQCRLDDDSMQAMAEEATNNTNNNVTKGLLTMDLSCNEDLCNIAPLAKLFRCAEYVSLDVRGSLTSTQMQTLRDRCCDGERRILRTGTNGK